jgi:hypothetical protein
MGFPAPSYAVMPGVAEAGAGAILPMSESGTPLAAAIIWPRVYRDSDVNSGNTLAGCAVPHAATRKAPG